MVVGIALRDLAPRSHPVGSDRLAWSDVLQRRQRVRFYRGCGRVLTLIGALIAALTMVLLLVDPRDSVSSTVLLVMLGLALVGFVGWMGYFIWQDSPQQRQSRQLQRLGSRMGGPARSPANAPEQLQPEVPAPRPAAQRSGGMPWPTPPTSHRPRRPIDEEASLPLGPQVDEAMPLPQPSRPARPAVARPWLNEGGSIDWGPPPSRRTDAESRPQRSTLDDDIFARSDAAQSRSPLASSRERNVPQSGPNPSRQPRSADD